MQDILHECSKKWAFMKIPESLFPVTLVFKEIHCFLLFLCVFQAFLLIFDISVTICCFATNSRTGEGRAFLPFLRFSSPGSFEQHLEDLHRHITHFRCFYLFCLRGFVVKRPRFVFFYDFHSKNDKKNMFGPRGSPKFPGLPRGSPEFPGVPRSSPEFPGVGGPNSVAGTQIPRF